MFVFVFVCCFGYSWWYILSLFAWGVCVLRGGVGEKRNGGLVAVIVEERDSGKGKG